MKLKKWSTINCGNVSILSKYRQIPWTHDSSFWKVTLYFSLQLVNLPLITVWNYHMVNVKRRGSTPKRKTGIFYCSLLSLAIRNHFCHQPTTLLKKRLWHRCFFVNFVKFLRIPFLQNTSGPLLLVSLCLKNSNSRNKLFMKKPFWFRFLFKLWRHNCYLVMWLAWRLCPESVTLKRADFQLGSFGIFSSK